MKDILIWMQKLLNITLKIYQIDYSTSKIKRTEYIRDFKIDTEISIMLNVQILNEGINIVECDSVYITNPNNNIANLIQRMSRANRITKDKQECRIYLWCSEKKVNKIMNYINENTNNELVNKVFKLRFDKNKLIEEKYISEKIYNINNSDNQLKDYSDEQLNNNLDKELKNYLTDHIIINKLNIDINFVDIFLGIFNKQNNINLENLSYYLNSNKGDLKDTLLCTYCKNKDYTIIKDKPTGKKGKPKEIILLTSDCVKLIIMKSNSKKTIEIKKQYNDLEEITYQYKEYIIKSLQEKINILENNQK
jgi:hypothetical protein